MNTTTYTGRYFTAMKQALDAVEVTLTDGKPSDVEAGFVLLSERCGQLKQSGGTLFFAGNGASAMMSSHMAVDFCKNAGVRSMAFNDAAFLTAIGNDLGYARAFEMPLSMMGRGGDVLATISSSGNSPNVILAIQAKTANLPAGLLKIKPACPNHHKVMDPGGVGCALSAFIVSAFI